MANILIEENTMTAIGNAIRNKNKTTIKYKPAEMPAAIDNLVVTDTSAEDDLVTRSITEYTNDRVTSVGAGAFKEWTDLVYCTLPNVEEMGTGAFQSSGLVVADFPKLTTTTQQTFSACKSLNSVNLPLLTQVNAYDFESCSALTEITLPSVTFVNSNGFNSCTSLEKIDLPVCTTFNVSTKCYKLKTLILRNTDKACTLSSYGRFDDTLIGAGSGYIYVPSALLSTYTSNSNYSDFASQFRAIEDYPEICG